MSKNIDIRSNLTKILIDIFYASGALTQVLVIARVIPYTWVNGGMSKTYSAQAPQSLFSLAVICLMYFFIRKIMSNSYKFNTLHKYTLYLITFFWTLGFLMQLLGTSFERYLLSLTLLAGIVGHVMLINGININAHGHEGQKNGRKKLH